MYIDNPKKLFDDLINIPTMYDYMVAVEEDGQQNDLYNLVSIVYHNIDQVWDGFGEGSLRWDVDLGDKQQILKDSKVLKNIWNTIKRELNSKYIIKCINCGKQYFYQKKPVYTIDKYMCGECKSKGALELLPFEEWASPDIRKVKNRYNF